MKRGESDEMERMKREWNEERAKSQLRTSKWEEVKKELTSLLIECWESKRSRKRSRRKIEKHKQSSEGRDGGERKMNWQ